MLFRDPPMETFVRSLGDALCWSKVELRLISDTMGYGLFAREQIRLGETVIRVPEKNMITAGMVANIPEYAAIIERVRLEPAELLALFFCLERVYLDCFCEQSDGFLVEWRLDIPPGFAQFMKARNKQRRAGKNGSKLWWRPYMGVLPLRFGTPLFRHYPDERCLRHVADQLPLQARDKLLGQLAELHRLEAKLFKVLYPTAVNGSPSSKKEKKDFSLEALFAELSTGGDNVPRAQSAQFWREICCWAWHIVNTRCIFVDNLPFHPLVDAKHRRFSTSAAADALQNGCNEKEVKKNGSVRMRKKRRRTRKRRGGEAEDDEEEEEEDDEDFGGSVAIIPFVDMLNHSTDAQCIAMFDHKHSRQYLIRAEQHSISAGDQLFVCYGAHDNARLWVEYGFKMEGWNPYNRMVVPMDLFIALAERCGRRISDRRQEVLRKADLPCTIYATDDLPSFALRKNCAILLLEREKLANWSQHIFADAPADEAAAEEAEAEEMCVLGPILERLQQALEGRKRRALEAEETETEAEEGEDENKKEGRSRMDEEDEQMEVGLWEEQIEIVRRMRQTLEEAEKNRRTEEEET